MLRRIFASALPLALAAGCSPAADDGDTAGAQLPEGPAAAISEVEAGDIPEAVRAAALARIPGMTIAGAERKERDGMVFYDVEGTRPDGSEVELDMLEENGSYRVVEVQRDIAWDAVPAQVRAAAEAKPGMFVPVRVIEGEQEDGTVLYELFAPGKPAEPAAEIALRGGKAEVMTERNRY